MRQPATYPDGPVAAEARPKRLKWFFVGAASLLVATVAIGFSRTFYLRWIGTEGLPPSLQALPLHIYLHGIVLTIWFALYFVQTVLIATHRTQLHRRLGVAGVVVALAVVVTSSITTQQAIAHSIVAPLADVPIVFFMTVGNIVLFSARFGAGVYFRRSPETHKRLMYLASVTLIGPAVSRLPGVIAFPPILTVVDLVLLGALIWRDFRVGGRLHRATLWGGIVLFVAIRVLAVSLGFSDVGRAVVLALA